MRKSEWSDEQIEELLRQLPKMTDERDPKEIHQNISIKISKRKNKVWIVPTAATAAALLLLFILVPSLFNNQNAEEKAMDAADNSRSAADIAMEKKSIQQDTERDIEKNTVSGENTRTFEAEDSIKKKENAGIKTIESGAHSTAVYEEDVGDMEVLTYAVPAENMENTVVPVSIIVSKEEKKSKLHLFEEYMEKLTENDWGLKEYYPLNPKLTFNEVDGVLNVDVPADYLNNLSRVDGQILKQVLSNTMTTLGIKDINLTSEGNTDINFGYYGPMDEKFISDDEFGNHAYYFYYPSNTEIEPFIVPESEKSMTVQEAFESMRSGIENENLAASIPESIQFDIEENHEERKLTLHFKEGSNINDNAETLLTIEAILLTAKEFNYDVVKLENAPIDKIGKFDLNQEIKVPVAANKRTIPLE